MNAKKCTRCKGFFVAADVDDGYADMARIEEIHFYNKAGFNWRHFHTDFCPACTRAFKQFLNGELLQSEFVTLEKGEMNDE